MKGENLDFGRMSVSHLFKKLLVPTVLGMVFSAVFVITDGIFVGKGVGSDALAAVNIAAPLFMITTGIGLMFGVGASVMASVHLSRGQRSAAGLRVTQAIVVSSLIQVVLSVLCVVFRVPLARLLGGSERLLLDVLAYMDYFVPFLVFGLLLNTGLFFIRLDGSPKYAMICNAVSAVINIGLDYLFIFVFGWGLPGAALATGIGTAVGGLLILFYLLRLSRTVRLCRIGFSRKVIRSTLSSVRYMMKLGSSAFFGEASIACLMFLGNFVFIRYLGEDGVAAFSIVCYFFPIIFMVYNAIAQSAQPIVSYNFGQENSLRVSQAFRLSLKTALVCGTGFFVGTALFREQIVSLFLDRKYGAYAIAVDGIPWFAAGYLFFAVNMVVIGYFQGVEKAGKAMFISLFRGGPFLLAGFFLLPLVCGVTGIWLAVPLAELLTLLLIGGIYLYERLQIRRRSVSLYAHTEE